MSGNAIQSTVSIEAVCAARDVFVDALALASEAFKQGNRAMHAALGGFYDLSIEVQFGGHSVRIGGEDDLATARREVDRAAWQCLFRQSRIEEAMSNQKKAELRKLLQAAPYERRGAEEGLPELTPENVEATFEQLFGNADAMLDDAVAELARRISWDHKTQQPCRFQERTILTYAVEGSYTGKAWSPKYDSTLYDLERVICATLGLRTTDMHKGVRAGGPEFGELCPVTYFSPKKGEAVAPLRMRGYKNGNAHLYLPKDTVAELNRRLHNVYPDALPPKKSK